MGERELVPDNGPGRKQRSPSQQHQQDRLAHRLAHEKVPQPCQARANASAPGRGARDKLDERPDQEQVNRNPEDWVADGGGVEPEYPVRGVLDDHRAVKNGPGVPGRVERIG